MRLSFELAFDCPGCGTPIAIGSEDMEPDEFPSSTSESTNCPSCHQRYYVHICVADGCWLIRAFSEVSPL